MRTNNPGKIIPDYKDASATTSFRQGLPESRVQGCVRRLPSMASGSRQSPGIPWPGQALPRWRFLTELINLYNHEIIW